MIKTHNEVIIVDDEPFKNCKFEREEKANILQSVLAYTKENAVVNLTAPWGYGKTTFLKMFTQKLKNDGTTCLYFSAWEYDYIEDPFSALIAHLKKELNIGRILEEDSKLKKVFKTAMPVVGNVGLKLLTANMLDIAAVKDMFSSETDEKISKEVGNIAQNVLNNYTNISSSIIEFKEALKDFAIGQPNGHIVIIIDELDRCRPNFAIEMLERVKHIMSVSGVKFVLGTDKKQLTESIKVLYGSNFNSQKYLERFIDFEYKLEIPNTKAYVESLIEEFDILNQEKLRKYDEYLKDNLIEMALFLADTLELDLRTLRQLFFQLHLTIITIPLCENRSHCMNKIYTEYLLYRLTISKIKESQKFDKIAFEKSMYNNANKNSISKSCALDLYYNNSLREIIRDENGTHFVGTFIHEAHEIRVLNVYNQVNENEYSYMNENILNKTLQSHENFKL